MSILLLIFAMLTFIFILLSFCYRPPSDNNISPVYLYFNVHHFPQQTTDAFSLPLNLTIFASDPLLAFHTPINSKLFFVHAFVHIPSALSSIKTKYPKRRFFLSLLLLLSGDINPNPGPSKCKKPSVAPDPFSFAALFTPISTSPSLTLACQNARSVRNKIPLVSELISSNRLDILCLTETWLNTDISTPSLLSSLTPPNFNLLHCDRPNSNRGGGLAILHHTSLKSKSLPLPIFSTFECLGSTITTGSDSFKLLLIYRPPAPPNVLFFEEFEALLEAHVPSPTELIITGDFNIHVDDFSDPNAKRFADLLLTFNLKQLVTFLTHPPANSNHKAHTLDLVITHSSSNIVSSLFSQENFFSDHSAVITELNLPKPNASKTTFTYRPIKSIDIDSFCADIQSSPLTSCTTSDLDTPVSLYNSTLSSILDQHASSRTVTRPSRPPNPWYNSSLLIEKRRKRQLERKWRKSHLPSDRSSFRRQCFHYNHLLLKSQSVYYKNLISSASNTNTLWKSINSVLHRKPVKILPSLPQLADKFCQFFSDKISHLRLSLPKSNTDPLTYPISPPNLLTSLEPASCEEIRKLILACPHSSSPLDPIPTTLLVSCIDSLLPIITKLVNLSLSTGCFPADFKMASVTPLLKKPNLDPDDLKNYRPISNLSFLSKLIERIVASRLTAQLSEHNLFNLHQSAYRKFNSTETALLSVQNDLLTSMDQGRVSALLLLDLSAAFDTVDHDILFHRLESWFGISNSALSWFKSFLTDRRQVVRTGDTTSSPSILHFGIPQGSVLGPILFSLYTTPLSSVIAGHTDIQHHLYADDTQIYLSFSSGTDYLSLVKKCVLDIFSWLSANKLSANPDKTEYILICPKKQTITDTTLTLSTASISPSDHAKNLGVIFQFDLSLDKHISAMLLSY